MRNKIGMVWEDLVDEDFGRLVFHNNNTKIFNFFKKINSKGDIFTAYLSGDKIFANLQTMAEKMSG